MNDKLSRTGTVEEWCVSVQMRTQVHAAFDADTKYSSLLLFFSFSYCLNKIKICTEEKKKKKPKHWDKHKNNHNSDHQKKGTQKSGWPFCKVHLLQSQKLKKKKKKKAVGGRHAGALRLSATQYSNKVRRDRLVPSPTQTFHTWKRLEITVWSYGM